MRYLVPRAEARRRNFTNLSAGRSVSWWRTGQAGAADYTITEEDWGGWGYFFSLRIALVVAPGRGQVCSPVLASGRLSTPLFNRVFPFTPLESRRARTLLSIRCHRDRDTRGLVQAVYDSWLDAETPGHSGWEPVSAE